MVINRLSQLGAAAQRRAARHCRRPARSARSSAIAWSGRPATRVTDLRPSRTGSCSAGFKSVPGVIDVTTWGGKSKTYDITVDLDRLLAYGLTLKQVLDALNDANINVGANTVNIGPQSAVIRSVGQIRTDGRHPQHHADGARRRAGAGVRRRHHHGRQRAAARHRRPRRRRRHRAGHRADAARRRDHADPARRRGRGRQDQRLRPAAARRAHRAHLRPQRPGRHHHPHRAAQHGDGRAADLRSSSGCSWATCAAR